MRNPNRPIATKLGSLRANIDGTADMTASVLEEKAKELGLWVSADGRVGEADLALLLGLSPGTLANKRREGTAPTHYALGGNGHRVTYRLADAAQWLEAHRDKVA